MRNRFKGQPVGGLPGELPAGETILWQGAPSWRALARRAFRIRFIAGYFALLVAWRVVGALLNGHGAGFAAASGISGTLLGGAATALFCAFAWLSCRTTTYTITSRRVVITYGAALAKSVNLPFSRIEAVNLKLHANCGGDIALKLPAKTQLSFLLLWPHARSGAQGRTEPVLRCVADAAKIADLLAEALTSALPSTERAVATRPAAADLDLIPARAA